MRLSTIGPTENDPPPFLPPPLPAPSRHGGRDSLRREQFAEVAVMAELLECDRCGDRAAGRIDAPTYSYSQLGGLQGSGSTLSSPGGPSVPGWVVEHKKLLCPQCKKNLDSTIHEFLKPRPVAT